MAYNFSDISVLVVDDDRTIKTLLASVINALKVKECYVAQDGSQGLEIFKQARPSVVVSDIDMPVMDGIKLTQEIRKIDKENNTLTPIILMSGHTNFSVLQKALDAGVTEYLVKPFAMKNLSQRINYVLSKQPVCIDVESYFGPDRRRLKKAQYSGPDRRGAGEDA